MSAHPGEPTPAAPETDDAKSFAQGVLRAEADAVLGVARHLDGQFDRAVDVLKTCAEAGGRVIVGGLGKSGLIGQKLSATLASESPLPNPRAASDFP